MDKLEHPQSDLLPISVRPDGKEIFSKDAHPSNTLFGSVVTPSGMVIFLRWEHPIKAFAPIVITVLGILTDSNDVQFSNNDEVIAVVLLSTTVFKLVHPLKTLPCRVL